MLYKKWDGLAQADTGLDVDHPQRHSRLNTELCLDWSDYSLSLAA